MSERETYTAVVTRSGKWWAIEIEEVPGVHSQARRLADVDEMARDAISLLLEVEPDSFDLVERVAIEGLEADIGRYEAVGALIAEVEEAQAAVRRSIIDHLSEQGIPTRDVAHVVGISHQRVSQIANEAPLGITPETVRNHVDAIYAKLAAREEEHANS